jgi:hypothetical protein
MATNHKISVDCVRSRVRKINVHIYPPEWQEFMETNIKKVYGYPSGGSIRIEALVTITVTAVILIIIALAVMLSLNG